MSDPPSTSPTAPVRLSAHRERIIEVLTRHFAEDALEVDEFESRVDRAHRATSPSALDALVRDLEPVDTSLPEESAPPAPAALEVTRPERKRAMAVMGGVECKGPWVVPRRLSATAIMGGVTLDFREAVLPPGVTEVKVHAIMGGIDVILPPHVAVEATGVALMGGFDQRHGAPPEADADPRRPILRISGFAVMGGCSIITRLPGESWFQARKRERKQRAALRAQAANKLDGKPSGRLGDGREP